MKIKWEKNERNFVLNGEPNKDFIWWISYNPTAETLNNIGETALVKKDLKDKWKSKFYILNGDFRKEYEELIDKGFDECKKFFDKEKEENINFLSNI